MAHIRRLDWEASVGLDDTLNDTFDAREAERESASYRGGGRRRGADEVSGSSLSGMSRDDESSSDGEHNLSPLNFQDAFDNHGGAIGVVVGETFVNPASLRRFDDLNERGEEGGGGSGGSGSGGGGAHGRDVEGGVRCASLRHEVRNPMDVDMAEGATVPPTSDGGGRASRAPLPDISSVTRRV